MEIFLHVSFRIFLFSPSEKRWKKFPFNALSVPFNIKVFQSGLHLIWHGDRCMEKFECGSWKLVFRIVWHCWLPLINRGCPLSSMFAVPDRFGVNLCIRPPPIPIFLFFSERRKTFFFFSIIFRVFRDCRLARIKFAGNIKLLYRISNVTNKKSNILWLCKGRIWNF